MVVSSGMRVGSRTSDRVIIFVGLYIFMTGVWMFLSGVNSMPEQVIKGDLDLLQLIWGIAVSILAFIFSKLMWNAGIRRNTRNG